jgi:hypothetical protein
VILGVPEARSPEPGPGLYAGGAASLAEGDNWSARSSWPVTSKGHYLRWDGGHGPRLPAPQSTMGSINVGSSAGARELFTRFDTGHR